MTRRPIKTLALALSIAGLAFAAHAQPAAEPAPVAEPAPATAPATETGSLTLTFSGIKTPTGALMVGLYDSQAAYDAGKSTQQVKIPVSGDTAGVTVEGLAPGTWAVKAFHDVDGDGKLATNPFGIPTEPYAFSNDARGSMGPPKWASAAFEIKAGANAHAIKID